LAGTLAIGCGEEAPTDCEDGADNDGDGLFDGADPGCTLTGGEFETPDPVECADGLDNDGDGAIDADDIGCSDADDDEERDPTRACNDGLDNDGDTFTDFPNDPGCSTPIDGDEYNPAACGDGLDNDTDGISDYPFDPGCTDVDDVDETDPALPPACSDGIDNDGDGVMDFGGDPGCSSAADDDEYNVIAGPCGVGVTVLDISGSGEFEGSLTGQAPNFLESPECGGMGAEFAFAYDVDVGPRSLIVTTDYPETTLDTIVYVRPDPECENEGAELACSDDANVDTQGSTVVLESVDVGTVYVIVDSYGPGSLGDFRLTIDERAPLHGPCDPLQTDECPPGLVCRELTPGAGYTCEPHACEDGIDNDGDTLIDYPAEPGCATQIDDDETDPPTPPVCWDTVDNDLDGIVDYPNDPGCDAASDSSEIDECIPGVPVIDHPGGAITGNTIGGSSLMGAPAGCDNFGNSGTSPERVYFYDVANDLVSLTFTTEAAAFDSIVYVRYQDCTLVGDPTWCGTNATGNNAAATISNPAPGDYYVVVDGRNGAAGQFDLRVSGVVDVGGACSPSDPDFVCVVGSTCGTSFTCEPSDCNDDADNDGDGDVDYPFDPGCDNVSDDDETDPAVLPQCGNGIDDDMDGFTDYPADSSCNSAADADEFCQTIGTTASGYEGCLDAFTGTPPCEDVSVTGNLGCATDDCTLIVSLPFTFTYFGQSFTQLTFAANGKLGFPGTSTYSNTCDIEDMTIAAFWDDLNPGGGGAMRWQTFGAAPNRHVTFQWQIPHLTGTDLYDIRAVIHETTNEIVVCYVDMIAGNAVSFDNGVSATVGIGGAAGEEIEYSCNSAVVTNGLLLRYDAP
jgi:hypothetical protein